MNATISQKIKDLKETIPGVLIEKHFKIKPALKEKYNEERIKLYEEDTRYHLSYLAESIYVDEPELFNEYLIWLKTFFASLPVTDEEIIENLELLDETITQHLPAEMAAVTSKFIKEGINRYKNEPGIPASFINETNPLNDKADAYLKSLIDGDKHEAYELIMELVKSGFSIKDIYLNIFQITQKETGRLWQMHKISVAQEHFITAATQMIMSQLYPYIFTGAKKNKSIIVSCINGELHELAPRMIADLFEMDGWNSFYYGANTPQSSLIREIEIYKPDILAVSATMTFNLESVADLIKKVRSRAELKDQKIIVGGYPFNLAKNLWEKIGANGFAEDALSAIKMAEKLISE